MKKFLIVFIFICVLFTSNVMNVQAEDVLTGTTGISLDVARRYYTVAEIKQYIDVMADNNSNSFFQLHLTDNENVGIECTFLDQTVENSIKNADGSYTNVNTSKKFLSYEQVKEIKSYAESKNIDFMPEIDVPAHMQGFFDLARIKYGNDYLKNVAVNEDEVPGELNITTEEGKKFVRSILSEYAEVFKGSKYFHIGGDEYFTEYKDQIVDFINGEVSFLKRKCFKVVMWNDLFHKDSMKNIDHDILVVYWSYDGQAQDEATREERIKLRASLPELQKEGFKIIVSNNYYLFFVPSEWTTTEHNLKYTTWDLNTNWDLDKWDYNYTGGLDNYDNIIGTMINVWSENSTGVENTVIVNQTRDMFNGITNKLKSHREFYNDKSKLIEKNNSCTNIILNNKENTELIENPQTGDSIIIYSILLIISIFGIFIVINLNKKIM